MCIINFLELAKKRYSLRNFDIKKIEKEELDLILRAGQLAPIAVRNAFNLPVNLEPICILPIGYPSNDAKPNLNHEKRKDILETVFYNHF